MCEFTHVANMFITHHFSVSKSHHLFHQCNLYPLFFLFHMSNQKRKYLQWEEANKERTVAVYQNVDMRLNDIFRNYGVPKKTLKRRVDGTSAHASGA